MVRRESASLSGDATGLTRSLSGLSLLELIPFVVESLVIFLPKSG